MLDGETPMVMRVISRIAALCFLGLAFGASPASAFCGGCYSAPVVVQPYYQSCGCCTCGSSYYGSYYPSYGYAGYPPGYGYGYGLGYDDGYGYGGYGYGGYGYGGYGYGGFG